MTRNRFQNIIKFLHFHDNSQMPERDNPNYDRLYKIRLILEHLYEKFQEVYTPRRDVCVDESLLFWKGRLIFGQYIFLKRARFGIKMFLCCESNGGVKGSGGYCYRFRIYAGKNDPTNEIQDILPADTHHLSVSEKMVIYLRVTLLDRGYWGSWTPGIQV
ncbi:PiggyBac transposable element-derived protein 4 [Plakobranchus ocellatus]|uniref:PiggyBac transposable element-derived protein 4 n=1 Tax=Plakobranchus ocellatus TaxID=259542 RepID=A0AAV4C866_9GAST|nr:PiggyBac transposable element-derived protein 4 [Plakobranchus ocellatus]